MPTRPPWHVPPLLWPKYAAGQLDPAAQAAVETHVVDCAACQRAAVPFAADPAPLWEAVQTRIGAPRQPWQLRALRRCGIPEADLVMAGAAGGLRIPWALAVGGAIVTAIVTAGLGSYHDAIYLLLAPLVPMLAVIGAYQVTDSLAGIARAAPTSPLRLALVRTVGTLVVAIPAALAMGALIPPLHPLLWLWLLPSLALSVTALALLTRLRAHLAAALLAAAWAITVGVCTSTGTLLDLVGADGQTGAALVVVAAATLFVHLSTTQPSGALK